MVCLPAVLPLPVLLWWFSERCALVVVDCTLAHNTF